MSFIGLNEEITSIGDRPSSARIPLVIGLFLAVIAIGLAIVPDIGARIVAFTVGVIAIILLVVARRQYRITSRLEPGVLEVPHRTFYLASQVPARFKRLVKKGTTDTVSLEAQLVQKEWVRYRVGTDTRTISADVQTFPVDITRTFDGRHVAGDLTLSFPSYPPSFEASDNKVTWELRVHKTFPDGFEEDSIVPLWVVPAARRSDLDRLGVQ